MVSEDDLTLGGGHTVQYIDHISQKCTLETYIILLTNKFNKQNNKNILFKLRGDRKIKILI